MFTVLVEMSRSLFLLVCGQHFNLWKLLEPYPNSQNFYDDYLGYIFYFFITSNCLTDGFLLFETPVKFMLASPDPWNHLQYFTHKLYNSCLMKQTLHIHCLFSLLLWCGIWRAERRHLIPLSLKETLCCLLLLEEPQGQKKLLHLDSL